MNILLLDNYDSFTYNLAQIIEQTHDCTLNIIKNDKIKLHEIEQFDKIVLSPGPGLPKDAGIMPELIQHFHHKKPILGVCLGHQAISEAFGAKLFNLGKVFHGVNTDTEIISNTEIFKQIHSPFKAGRYHSWAVSRENFPKKLQITSLSKDGVIMSLQHTDYPIYGVQFHPESILTPMGKKMIENFLNLCVHKK